MSLLQLIYRGTFQRTRHDDVIVSKCPRVCELFRGNLVGGTLQMSEDEWESESQIDEGFSGLGDLFQEV